MALVERAGLEGRPLPDRGGQFDDGPAWRPPSEEGPA